MLLEITDVSAAYGNGIQVLFDVDATITRGKTVAVVGESGSGKSTLARVVTGLLPPFKGSISFDGEPLAASFKRRKKESLRRLQMIYQMPMSR